MFGVANSREKTSKHTAERTGWGQSRGSGREWDKVILAIEGLPQKDGTEEVGESISL